MLNEKMVCSFCGEVIEDSENYYETAYGEIICERCYEDEYFTCEDCGKIYPIEEMVQVEDGRYTKYVCEECVENDYEKCEDCGEYHLRDYMYYVNNPHGCDYYVCELCFESNYFSCDNCGEIFHVDDLRYNETRGMYFCEDCYPNDNELILNYHGFSDWETYYVDEYNESIRKGFELEVATDDYDVANDIYDILGDFVVFEEDGSIDGFEMITNPFTRDFWNSESNIKSWKEVFYQLNSYGCGTRDCGLHVHVNRVDLATSTQTSDEVIDKIIIIMETFKDELMKFSRRTENDLKRWASFLTDKGERLTFKNIKDKKRKDDRYVALNLTKRATIEFRIFKSTMTFKTLMATLELVDNIVDIARSGAIDGLTWNDIVNFNGDYITQYVNDYDITSDTVLEIVEDVEEYQTINDFHVGDVVNYEWFNSGCVGKGTIIDIDTTHNNTPIVLIYNPTFDGHNAGRYEQFKNTKFKNHLLWFNIDKLSHVTIPFEDVSELSEGDRVLVRSDLEDGTRHGNDVFVDGMESAMGRVCTVKEINKFGNKFTLNICNGYNFTPQMCVGKIAHEEVCTN